MEAADIVARQRAHFETGATLPYEARITALDALGRAIAEREGALTRALAKDLGKAPYESFLTEIGLVRSEISYLRRHLKSWMRPKRVRTPLAHFPAKSMVMREPLGVTLIMAPWNYPVLLNLDPLADALAAGNCCVVKPASGAPATSAELAALVEDTFSPELVSVVEGGRAENQALLDCTFDHIFFTGSPAVGRYVLERAAQHLTPVTLELGGKSPAIVDATADVTLAAKRIAFGKFLNSGQTCVAPDYVLAHADVADELTRDLRLWRDLMLGEDPLQDDSWPHMVSARHFERVLGLIDPDKVAFGGRADEATLSIEPTVLVGVTPDDAVMREEIFGPILPILTWKTTDELLDIVRSLERPLALYLFTRDEGLERLVLERIPFGGGCVNDTVVHLATPTLPFGGVGGSGMGAYHGRAGFDTFSHEKSVLVRGTWADPGVRYHPYTPIKEKVARLLLR